MTISKSAAGFEREAHDHYVEPAWCVEALADAEGIAAPASVWDPACGIGTIPEVFRARGCSTMASDIVNRGYNRLMNLMDFEACEERLRGTWIVCNPPYNRLAEWAIKCRKRAQNTALLVRLGWLSSGVRHDMFTRVMPPSAVWVLSDRPSMLPGHLVAQGQKASGGAVDYCWVVWRQNHAGPTQLGWLRKPAGSGA